MTEPLALTALRLPYFLFKILTRLYIGATIFPAKIVYKLTHRIIFFTDHEPYKFQMKHLMARLFRAIFSILVTILYIGPVSTPIWLLYAWIKGLNQLPRVKNAFERVLRIPDEGRLNRIMNLEGANLSLGSKMLIYGVCLMVVAITAEKQIKKFGKTRLMGFQNYKMVFVFIYAGHSILDVLTLALFIPTIPFRSMLKNEKYEERTPYLGHYLIAPNFVNFIYLVPILLAFIIHPIAKKMNFREHAEINDMNCYTHSLEILWLFLVFSYDMFCLVWLSGFYYILKRNNFVPNWRIFSSKALKLNFMDRIRFYFNSFFLCIMYFKKQDYIYDLKLFESIKETELLPKAVVDSISQKFAQSFSKFHILTNVRRSAALNIAREQALSFKNANGSTKFDNINQYFVDKSINEAIEANQENQENGQNEGRILDQEAVRLNAWNDLVQNVDLSTKNRFSEAKKLWNTINKSTITFQIANFQPNLRNYEEGTVVFFELDKDLNYLRQPYWTDVWSNFLVILACVLNPLTGIQFLRRLKSLDFTKMTEINKFNYDVRDLYPYIFLDIIGLALFLVLTPVNFMLGNFKSTTQLLKHFFGKGEISPEMINLSRSDFLFGNIWRCDFFYFSSIIRTVKFYMILPIAIFSPKELKQYREFRNAHWFSYEHYGKIARYASRVFLSLFWAKFAMKRRRASKEEKQTLKDIMNMCEQQIWDKHTLKQWIEAKFDEEPIPEEQIEELTEAEIQDEAEEAVPPQPQQNVRRRCRCNFLTARFWLIIWTWVTTPFRFIGRVCGRCSRGISEFRDESKKANERYEHKLKAEILTWDRNYAGYTFAKNCVFEVYQVQAACIKQYAAMMKYEKWLKSMNKSQKNEQDGTTPVAPNRPEKLVLTDQGTPSYSNIDKYLKYLIHRQALVNKNLLKIKEFILSSIIKLVSLTLLWRALDVKVYFNTPLIMKLFAEPREGEPKKPSLLSAYLQVYKLCFKNLILDFVYWWGVIFMLRVDKPLWDLCNRKIEEAKFRTLTNVGGDRTEEFKLDTLEEVAKFDSVKRSLVREYAGYSLNERLENILFILGRVFVYRAEMIEKISNLKRIPQYQNIDNRTANLLIVRILGVDLLLFCCICASFIMNPLRIISFYYFVKNGSFRTKINPMIHFDRFQSYQVIKADAKKRLRSMIDNVLKSILSDAKLTLKICLFFIFPIRLLQLSKVYLNVRMKLRRKKSKEDNQFCDHEFSEKMHTYINEVLVELKKDASSAFAIFIILMGVFHVKNTWRRVKSLVYYQAKQTAFYSWWQTVKKRNKEQHLAALGILNILIKCRLYKKKEKKIDQNRSNRVILKEIGWQNMLEVGDYLTVKDRMVMCTVNKNTREYYMKNSVLWLKFYKRTIFNDVTQVETFATISYQCISYARKLEAEKNMSKERDFKLGLRYILKEQAIRSIISLPDLVSTPYKAIALGVEKMGVTYVNPNEKIRQHRENAEEVERLRAINRPIMREELRNRGITRCYPKYAVTFKNNFNAISGNVNENVSKIDRVRGFLYLETIFYKLILFLGTINAFARRPFFWPLYNNQMVNIYQVRNIFVASWNCFKATLQLVYCGLVGYALWKYLMLLIYTFNYDFLSALAGPFLLHPMIGFHLVKEVRITTPYLGTNFSLFKIFSCYGAWLWCAADWSILPILRAIRTVFTYIFKHGIHKTIRGIKKTILYFIEMYELTLVWPTILLVKRGVILEFVHLIYTLVWILWPLAFIWGYVSLGANFSLVFGMSKLWNNVAVDKVRELSYSLVGSRISAVWAFIAKETLDAYKFFIGNFIVVKILQLWGLIKRIWVIGHFIRFIIWIISFVLGKAWSAIAVGFGIKFILIGLFRYLFVAEEVGKNGIETGGSLLPKITLSIIILSFKITRAIKVMKNNKD